MDGSAFTRLDQDLCPPPIIETVEPIVEEETAVAIIEVEKIEEEIIEKIIMSPIEFEKQANVIIQVKMGILLVLFLAVLLSPLYVVNEFTTLSKEDLKTILLNFLYACLVDMFAFRPVAIIIFSIIEIVILEETDAISSYGLKDEQVNLVGAFYDLYRLKLIE